MSHILIMMVMSILRLSVYGQKSNDHMCSPIVTVVCVKTVLSNIAKSAKDVDQIVDQIETNILEREPTPAKLERYVNSQINQIRSNVLTSEFHHQLMNVKNNINKTDFIHLIKEENYAFNYLYNSIKNILKLDYILSDSTNKFFKRILNNLRKNILCNYRNIFHVYSEPWLSTDQIDGYQSVITRKRNAPSFSYNRDSMIVSRLLHEWVNHINNLVVNIESKLLQ